MVKQDVAVTTLWAHITNKASQPDVYWIAQTREAWMAETGLTLKQYKRAISCLKNRGLVRVRMMRSGGRTLTHLVVVPRPRSGGPSRDHVEASYIPNTVSIEIKNKDHDLVYGKGASRSTEADDPDSGKATGVRHKGIEEDESKQGTGVAPEGWLMKATDILKNHSGRTATSLEGFWKERCKLVFGRGYQKRLSSREAAQLKQLSKYLEDAALTRRVITYAIEHWVTFATLAAQAAGVTTPAEPHIGFLLKYHATIVNVLAITGVEQDLHSSSAVSSGGETPVQPVAQIVESEPVHVLSAQELTAMLDELKTP